jgi:DNA-binding MarR family transcriptional regulator
VPTPATTTTTTTGPEEIIEALAPLLAHQRNRWAARCQAHGLSIIGFQVLALLEMNDGIPMSRLAEELDVALPNATGIVGRMAERGIVQRSHDAVDRRVVRVGLTDAGRQLIGEMEATRRERMTRLIGAMDATQQRRLLQSVRDLHAAARQLQQDEEAPPA